MGASAPASAVDRPEFSRPIEVSRIGPSGLSLTIEATAEERVALAGRLGIREVRAFSAEARLMPRGAGIALTADWRADIVQDCVVTLDPVEAHLAETCEIVFGPGTEEEPGEEIEIDLDIADPPEAIVDGRIDIGEAVAEQLALAIDPYPRKAGAVFEGPEEEPEPRASPFAALGGLRKGE